MPSNQTAHYALSQWVKSDQVRMEDFNADNAKLDAALKAAEQRSAGLDAKINTTAAAAEQRSAGLDAKINATAAAAEQRSAAVAAAAEKRSAALDAAKGNCTIEFFSYVGQGRSGMNNPTTITFRKPPLFFIAFGTYSIGVGSKHSSNVIVTASDNVFPDQGSWRGNTISFYNSDPRWQLDTAGETFYVFAFYTPN
ncbi:MAG: hypothetical protein HFF42_02745 [Lawsonibacter sp.]|jgi:hypothetical protein|nr:hypothetical protein [Lawsonibacter sp.]